MARAKYQVLVLPYKKQDDSVFYCVFQRSDTDVWQFIAGSGEEEDASPLISAKREAYEEARIPFGANFRALETTCSIPTKHFKNARPLWGGTCLVIPEYCFAAEVTNETIKISHEHTNFEWIDYQTALQRLKFDSNKTALWELDQKIRLGIL